MQECRRGFSISWRVTLAVLVGIAGVASNGLAQTSYQIVAAFDRSFSFGAYPYAGLIQGTDGSFYGTTIQGGTAAAGTIFKIDASGTLTVLHSFNGADGRSPQAGLIQGSDGSFYGTTPEGGAAGYGTIFKINAAGTLTSLHSFTSTDGANPYGGLLQGSDGSYYGTTSSGGAAGYGTVFKMDATGALTTLNNFDSSNGAAPFGSLIQASDGSIYGTTKWNPAIWYGTIFKIDAAGTLTTVHRFNEGDGGSPSGGVIQASDGSIYGTTQYGGPGGGTIFKIDGAGTLTTLHSFDGSHEGSSPYGGVTRGIDGGFYGTTTSGGAFGRGTIFKFDTAGTVTTLHSFNYSNGASPAGGVIQGADGSFYGTTSQGGALGSGTIFRIDPAGTLTSLYGFGAREPRSPAAGLIQAVDGSFLGTTAEGGAADRGTIFKVDAGTLTILHSFASNEGASPQARLLQASDGSFYGTTFDGGADGTIFKIDAAGTLTTLHSFNSSDGAKPSGGLIEGGDGSFYGTTSHGGSTGQGTVFKIDAAGTLTTLHSFNYTDGMFPFGGLIQGSDGSLYGVASSGGGFGCGTVFKIDAAGTLTTLHSFDCGAGGGAPYGGVIQGSDGSFYGTTYYGGALGWGTVFKVDGAGTQTTLHSFNYSDGANPYGGLIQGREGSFYGTTTRGGAGCTTEYVGTIFKMDAEGTLTTLHSFNCSDGPSSNGSLIQGRDGNFYGTTARGGANGSGAVFRLSVQMPTSTTMSVSPSPSMSSQSITLTAIVTTPGFTPTGSVAFFDGSSSLGTGTFIGGTATLRTSTLSSGSHALRAEYGGASTFAPSTSPVLTHIVVLPAAFIYPANGATNVDLTQPFTWTSVVGVQAYYLYVGTSVAAKDLVNTGEIQQTSYPGPLTLASGATLYARLWTKVGGTWRYVDASFSAPPIARFTYPAASTTAIDPTLPLTWTTVPAAQAYYLYIGSTPGAKDLVNTGEMLQTSYVVRNNLPINQTLYARLWTKGGGVWRFTDRTFTAMPAIARFTYPFSGATAVDPTRPFAWTTVPTAQAYYLYVGSMLGGKDIVNTGELAATADGFFQFGLSPDQPLYARLWTKAAGVWRFVDITFTVKGGTAAGWDPALYPGVRFIYPAAGATWADMSQAFEWTPVANVRSYHLYVGTALGLGDLVDSGEIQTTSYLAANLPRNRPLYARLWMTLNFTSLRTYIDRVITSISPDATIIDFTGLTVNGSTVSAYAEDGFSVQATSGEWHAVTTYGHPIPFIEFSGGSTVSGEVRISAGGAAFSFNSVDLYSSTTPIPFTITGRRNSSTVFTVSGTLPNTYGEFRTVANPGAAAVIDELSIVLTNSACCGNPMGLDTIVLTR